MKCCTFCSEEAEMLFSHLINDVGSLCLECYLRLHGCCGVCNVSVLPTEVQPDVEYQLKAKFIGTGDKNYMVCNDCDEFIRREFLERFA